MEEYKLGCVYIGKSILEIAKKMHEDFDISPEAKAEIAKETNEIMELLKKENNMGISGIEILKELKQEDYESYCHRGFSMLREEQWDFVIDNFKRKKNEEVKKNGKR